MSPDESFVFFICSLFSVLAWIKWYWQLSSVAPLSSSGSDRKILKLTPLIAGIILFIILKSFASHDVRDDPAYLLFYMGMGAAWLGLARAGLHGFGLSARDDVIERGNKAAAYAVSGGLLGIALCFAGGNIGDGPGWWVVVFAAALSTGTFFLLWILLNQFTGLADTVTIDRDAAAGLRLAGLFIAIGLILGRAVAGNWVSADATVVDFVEKGCPVLLVLGAAIPLERRMRPAMDRSSSEMLNVGGVPALFYIVIAIVVLFLQGRWT